MSDEDRTPPFPFTTDITFQRGDVVFATDKRGRLVYWNKESEQLFGYAASDVLGNPFDVICLAATGGSEISLPAIMAGRDFAGGVRCSNRSGREVALYVYATAGRSQSGAAAGIVFVARDVSEFWRAEEAVLASDDRYRLLFEQSSDAVVLSNPEGRILEANPSTAALTGFTRDELVRMTLRDLIPPGKVGDAESALARLREAGAVRGRIDIQRKDGRVLTVERTTSLVSVAGEQRLLIVSRDASDRVRAEQATRESERKYRTVFDSANDAVFIETVDGSILDVNDNACRLFGYTREEFLEMKVPDLVPVQARAWLPRVTDAILRDRAFRAEAVNLHKSGRQVPVEISASTMELNDRTLVLAIVRDISERKRAEAALAESENRYRTLFNDSLMGIYRTSPGGQILLANPALVRMLGYESFAQLAERNLETDGFGLEYRRDEFKRRLERDGRIVGLEARWQTRDGRTLFVRESARAVCGLDGAVLYYEGTVEDITERRRAEIALRVEKERAQQYLDVADVIIVALDRTGVVTLANRRACAVLGYEEKELVGRDWFQTCVPERLGDSVRAAFGQLIAGQSAAVERYENPVVTASGQERLVVWHNALLRDDAGHVVGTLSSGEDITERSRGEAALAASEAQYRTLFDSIRDGVYLLDRDGRFTSVNDVIVNRSGRPREWWLGRDHVGTVRPEDRGRVRQAFEAAMRGKTVVPCEAAYPTASGELLFIEMNVAPIREGDKVVGMVGISRDTTGRKSAEKRLQESEERFRRLVEMSPDGIAVHQNGRLVLVNPAGARVLGYERPEELVGKPVFDFVHPDDQPGVLARIEQVMQLGKPGELVEERFRRKDGTYVPVEVVNAPFYWRGKPAVQVVVRDISGRRELARAAEVAEAQMQAILANSPDGIAAACDGVTAYANRRFAELYGYDSPAQVTGRPVTDFLAPEDQERVAEYSKARTRGDQAPTRYRFKGIRRDSTLVEVEITVSTYSLLGRQYLLGFLREAAARPRRSFSG
jgi:PAS domain S-box-containing protein